MLDRNRGGIWIFLLLTILIVILTGVVFFVLENKTHISYSLGMLTKNSICETKGGIWQSRGGQTPFCNEKMPDAGVLCSNSDECQSRLCYTKEKNGQGHCGEYLSNLGCFYVVKEGKTKDKQTCFD